MTKNKHKLNENCRSVIRACLNIVEENGDTYIAIHKDDDIECVVLVSIIRTYPILSVVVADKILFAQENADAMYRAANELNIESVVGWHSIMLSDSSSIYMYRECAWINEQLDRDYLMEILLNCISEYKLGRAHLSAAIQKEQQ